MKKQPIMVNPEDKRHIEELLPEYAEVIDMLEAKLLTSTASTNDFRVAVRLLKVYHIATSALVNS